MKRTAALAATETFLERRAPDPGWRDLLATVSPPSLNVPYLWLDWLAGEPHDPVQRWALWEVLPAQQLERLIRIQRVRGIPECDILLCEVLANLRGPSPRAASNGRWVGDRTMKGGTRWQSNSLVNQQQWELWRTLKGFASLFWIIQGDRGGHKRTFNPQERKRLTMMGRSPDAPVPGALAYAPFDQRVADHVLRADKLARWNGDWRERTRTQQAASEIVQFEREAERSSFQVEIDDWLREQTAEPAGELVHTMFREGYEPRGGF